MDELKPILVTSPTIRCGTTLLQRLLCSSSNALIYGEEIAKDLEMQLQIFASRKMIYSHSRARFVGSLDRVMQGDTNDWIPDLMPDIDDYLEALRQGSFAGLECCRQQALLNGRTEWGFKYPGWSPQMMQLLVNTLPETRVIYIYRNLPDCVRSAKTWGEIQDEAGLQQFCAQWVGHRKFMQQWQPASPVLMLSYEALISEPEHTIQQLCRYVAFENVNHDVLRHKINSSAFGVDAGVQRNNYIEPAALTANELEYIEAIMATLG